MRAWERRIRIFGLAVQAVLPTVIGCGLLFTAVAAWAGLGVVQRAAIGYALVVQVVAIAVIRGEPLPRAPFRRKTAAEAPASSRAPRSGGARRTPGERRAMQRVIGWSARACSSWRVRSIAHVGRALKAGGD
ncbi:hypothetical protein ABZ511_27405 [Nocardia gamkensis]|uniref:hypothetical protein n=1 Tax=Nocardia gamkensis TaxID=352869 RepID=UPI0033E109C0